MVSLKAFLGQTAERSGTSAIANAYLYFAFGGGGCTGKMSSHPASVQTCAAKGAVGRMNFASCCEH